MTYFFCGKIDWRLYSKPTGKKFDAGHGKDRACVIRSTFITR